MRYAILSDVHANLAALEAVLEDLRLCGGADVYWNLGDTVGYGPDPLECIEMLTEAGAVSVAGNHDWAAIGKIGTENFNPYAAESARWTAGHLGSEEKSFLERLGKTVVVGDFTLVHGSPRDPIWEYLVAASLARENFGWFDSRICLVGHSHLPLFYFSEEQGLYSGGRFHSGLDLNDPAKRFIINPGAVGQPRDGNPRAAYAIFDSGTGVITPRRVDYDIRATQKKMKMLGLPVGLSARLENGV